MAAHDLSVYTQLALEANALAVQRRGASVPGIEEEKVDRGAVEISRIGIQNEEGAQEVGKDIGDYITLTARGLRSFNRQEHHHIAGIIADELQTLLGISDEEGPNEPTFLIVGLGNWRATPDALGPRVAGNLLVTRHLYQQTPPELRRGMRSVCALAPGVLGITGIETGEIIKGCIDRVQPDILLVVDALAAYHSSRLGSTVQLSNTGIAPGSGVGGSRLAIKEENMGIPVIAMGVPTVVHAYVVARETLEEYRQEARMYRGMGHVSDQMQDKVLHRVLEPFGDNAIMTPKGIDALMEQLSRVLASAVNMALHPDICEENLELYLHH